MGHPGPEPPRKAAVCRRNARKGFGLRDDAGRTAPPAAASHGFEHSSASRRGLTLSGERSSALTTAVLDGGGVASHGIEHRWEQGCRAIASTCERLRVRVKKVNIHIVELDESLDEAGFRHVATSVGSRLGAQRIGASVYQAEAGVPIWPYHYHHGIEEWLYVIAGTPVLREPAGERILTSGDLVCFPSGHLGAHTVKGPGRFVIFATGQHDEPWMSVYPDSDKASGPEGIFLRSSAVGYWHGEGTAGSSEPAEIVREPKSSPPQPTVNLFALGAGRRPRDCESVNELDREPRRLILFGLLALAGPSMPVESRPLRAPAEARSRAPRLSAPPPAA
jgi:uncharacterized cupin superfamily protein